MPVPFTVNRVTITDSTPVLLASWQRTSDRFRIVVRNETDWDNAYLTNSPTGTDAISYTVEPHNEFSFEVPAVPPYSPTPATESLYVFTKPGKPLTVCAFIAPH
ncbi:hypothetical protein [Nocardia farcinica]|uniref:hypothetical protein n=1 Tax=Nocardia farcinica TaxID=37329 RepID=UPI001893C6DD|nr:hypothetical protein [Nocardia farcinica]MBF6188009.1 hypothetical protein [Nocardia farcinica]